MKSLKSIAIVALLILVAAVMVLGSIDLKLYVAYGIFAIAVLALVAFMAISLTSAGSGKNTVTLIGGAALVGLLVLFYFITPTTDVGPSLYEKTGTGMGWSPIIGSGLYTIYALLAFFVGLLAFFGVKNMIK